MSNAHFVPRAHRRFDGRLLLGIALLLGAVACSRLPHAGEDDSEGPAYLVFVNQSLEQADVFAVGQAGDATRIGTVQPGRTETIRIPDRLSGRGPINIIARLLGRPGTLQSGAVSFNAGDRMQATVSIDGRSLVLLPVGP